MLTPDEARARIVALGAIVGHEDVPLIDALGRWLSEPLIARRTQPARDLSSMDGYAVNGPGPWHVLGTSAAGKPFDQTLRRGQAARIFTGAATPPGTEAVIIQENVTATGDSVARTDDKTHTGQDNIRIAGSDFVDGQVLAEPGRRVTPALVGLAAIAGHAALPVHRRVRVALISTGDELVAAGEDTDDATIPASNAVMLAALLADLPCDLTDFGIVPDRLDMLTNALKRAADCDIVVTTGGASVGDHDYIRAAMSSAGAAIDFWKIAMRPGKPLIAGTLGIAVFLGLPGNPVSSFVTATLFLRALIAAMSGASDIGTATSSARLTARLPAVERRTDYVRAIRTGDDVTPLDGDSGMLLALARANALIVRPADSIAAAEGDVVTIIAIA